MEISIKKGKIFEQICDVLIFYMFQGSEHSNDFISTVLKEEKFKGKLCQTVFVRTDGRMSAKRVLVVGLGKEKEFDLQSLRRASAVAFLSANKTQSFVLVTDDGRILRHAQQGIERGEIGARATIFTRDLVNTPAQDMRPINLVESAKSVAKGKGEIRVRVFDQTQLEKMGAGGILGIAKGSDDPPFLVHLTYCPKKKSKKKIAIVGKGITFDSGGLSLKPAASMFTMKIDMAGAADVLGLFSVIDEIVPVVEVHGIFAAVEHMPSGCAVRPGDILRAMNGKTMEILNTDAEGRVILADSLLYAVKQKPDMIIDLATLTGACVVALGDEISGVMSNDPKLANRVLVAAAGAGEKMWELPLEKNYKQFLKSDVADLKNIGGKYGDVISAGLFLEEFVNKTPWAHLDIAGPCFAERDLDEYTKKGATGHGVRTLIEFLRGF